VCTPEPVLCPVTIDWSYSGEDLNDSPVFIITVNGEEVINAPSCVFPDCPQIEGGTIVVTQGDIVVLTIGNQSGFHIYTYVIEGSVDGEIASGGGDNGQSVIPFTASCQTYTITGTQ
jgi:hypothetical protein